MTTPSDPIVPRHAQAFGDPLTSQDKEGAAIAHISVFVGHFFGPLIVYLIYKDQAPYVRFHAVQAMLLYAVLAAVGIAAAVAITIISAVTCGLGSLLYLALIPFAAVPLWPAWKAYNGDWEGLPGLGQFGR